MSFFGDDWEMPNTEMFEQLAVDMKKEEGCGEMICPIDVKPAMPSRTLRRPTICNVVAKIDLGVEVCPRKIAQRARNGTYDPRRLDAVVLRIREPKSVGLIFSKGTLITLGTKTISDAKKSSRVMARMMQKIGYPEVRWRQFRVMNVFASASIGFNVDLELLSLEDPEFCIYEPEIFSGAQYKIYGGNGQSDVYMTIWHSGKMMMISHTVEGIHKAFARMTEYLWKYKMRSIV